MGTIGELGRGRTVLLATRKRDGSWVATPVSLVVDGGRGYFKTYDASGKAKRLRNFADVRVAPSTMRGQATGPSVVGKARLIGEPAAGRVERLLARKHPVLHRWLVPALHRRRGWTTLYYELTLESS